MVEELLRLFGSDDLMSAMVYISPSLFQSMDGSSVWVLWLAYHLRELWALSSRWSKVSYQGGPSVVHTKTPLVSVHYLPM